MQPATQVVKQMLLRPNGLLSSMQRRGMATEKQIFDRIQATKNISKITASMKMVSAAKLKGDENRLAAAKPYNAWTEAIMAPAENLEELPLADKFGKKVLVIPFTSDRGLCGGVNNYVLRYTRQILSTLAAEGKEGKLLVVGEKGRAGMRRLYVDQMVAACTDLEVPITYATAAGIASNALAEDVDQIAIVYNVFKSAIAYDTTLKIITPFHKLEEEPMADYEFEPDSKGEVLMNLGEHAFASNVFYGLMEAAASEQSSRMSAMENASKNAGELIDSLTLQYNRARQARITTELIEIISGASALEG
mmetsp:Transcript_22246/g.27961  ORF Transcript_22246/g.27961 Transcript_22246/m.27961 type:complete len:306 (+) Transcript_22246:64-981(+)